MKARTIALAIIGTTALAIALVMGSRLVGTTLPKADIDTTVFTTCGIDISAHNGHVDFRRLHGAGVDFVYIKASEGATWRDPLFEENYLAATSTPGLAVGAYHFFRFDVEGWRQSVNLLRAINGRRLDLPVAIDIEEWGNPGGHSTDAIISSLRSMVELLRQAGREVIIYTNKNGYHRFVKGRLDDIDLWICSFTDPPLRDRARWTLWQHSHVGTIDGVAGPVDLNTFNIPHRGTFADYLSTRPGITRMDIR